MLSIEPIYTKFSLCGTYSMIIERHHKSTYDSCYMVVIYEHGTQQGQAAFNTFGEALDFVYDLINSHKREV